MWCKKAQLVLLTAALGLFVASLGLGQTITSSIVGHVSDASGAAVPGAVLVTVGSHGSGLGRSARTGPFCLPIAYSLDFSHLPRLTC